MCAMFAGGPQDKPPTYDAALWERALALAYRPYQIDVFEDELSTGGKVFVAQHPELPGCHAQGYTPFEAVNDLAFCRADYLYHLLANQLDIPEPVQASTTWQ